MPRQSWVKNPVVFLYRQKPHLFHWNQLTLFIKTTQNCYRCVYSIPSIFISSNWPAILQPHNTTLPSVKEVCRTKAFMFKQSPVNSLEEEQLLSSYQWFCTFYGPNSKLKSFFARIVTDQYIEIQESLVGYKKNFLFRAALSRVCSAETPWGSQPFLMPKILCCAVWPSEGHRT